MPNAISMLESTSVSFATEHVIHLLLLNRYKPRHFYFFKSADDETSPPTSNISRGFYSRWRENKSRRLCRSTWETCILAFEGSRFVVHFIVHYSLNLLIASEKVRSLKDRRVRDQWEFFVFVTMSHRADLHHLDVISRRLYTREETGLFFRPPSTADVKSWVYVHGYYFHDQLKTGNARRLAWPSTERSGIAFQNEIFLA